MTRKKKIAKQRTFVFVCELKRQIKMFWQHDDLCKIWINRSTYHILLYYFNMSGDPRMFKLYTHVRLKESSSLLKQFLVVKQHSYKWTFSMLEFCFVSVCSNIEEWHLVENYIYTERYYQKLKKCMETKRCVILKGEYNLLYWKHRNPYYSERE